MHRQLEFWPTLESTQARPQVWEKLSAEQQANLIAALARLIRKAIYPEQNHEIQEKPHEQS